MSGKVLQQNISKSGSEEESQPSTLTKDDAYHLLQNARRRAVLRYIMEHNQTDQFQIRDLAEAVASWENDTTVQDLTSAERQRVYISLYQSHLPKLDEHDVIDYQQNRGVVTILPLARVLGPLLGDGLDAPQTFRADETYPKQTSNDRTGGILARLGLV